MLPIFGHWRLLGLPEPFDVFYTRFAVVLEDFGTEIPVLALVGRSNIRPVEDLVGGLVPNLERHSMTNVLADTNPNAGNFGRF